MAAGCDVPGGAAVLSIQRILVPTDFSEASEQALK
jgi:hypothetical protein